MEKTQKLQRVALCIDSSSSMGHLAGEAKKLYEETIAQIQAANNNADMQTEITLIEFNSSAMCLYKNLDINDKLPEFRYVPRGMTAMLDAVRLAVDTIKSNYPEMCYLVLCITDGQENSSTLYSIEWMGEGAISKLQDRGNWTFSFLVPDRIGQSYLEKFGVPSGNIKIWKVSKAGMDRARVETCSAMDGYYKTRSAGGSSTKSFFQPVTPDLSKVKSAALSQMDEVTNLFRMHTVDKESKISEFVRGTLGKIFIKGDNFYQLMKKEIVSFKKSIILYEKKTGKLYTGTDARRAVGLPDWRDARVTPGNHANFDIFVQSTSDNRILSRGTKLLSRR